MANHNAFLGQSCIRLLEDGVINSHTKNIRPVTDPECWPLSNSQQLLTPDQECIWEFHVVYKTWKPNYIKQCVGLLAGSVFNHIYADRHQLVSVWTPIDANSRQCKWVGMPQESRRPDRIWRGILELKLCKVRLGPFYLIRHIRSARGFFRNLAESHFPSWVLFAVHLKFTHCLRFPTPVESVTWHAFAWSHVVSIWRGLARDGETKKSCTGLYIPSLTKPLNRRGPGGTPRREATLSKGEAYVLSCTYGLRV
jgi:hypothetical protein